MKKLNREVWLGLGIILFSLFFIKKAMSFGEASKYPIIILGMLGILSFGLFLHGTYYYLHPEKYKKDTASVTLAVVKQPIFCFLTVIIYIALFKLSGFFISTAIFIPCIMFLFGERKIVNIVLTILGMEIFVYLVFVKILSVNFNMI